MLGSKLISLHCTLIISLQLISAHIAELVRGGKQKRPAWVVMSARYSMNNGPKYHMSVWMQISTLVLVQYRSAFRRHQLFTGAAAVIYYICLNIYQIKFHVPFNDITMTSLSEHDLANWYMPTIHITHFIPIVCEMCTQNKKKWKKPTPKQQQLFILSFWRGQNLKYFRMIWSMKHRVMSPTIHYTNI